jgi:dihydroorotate dehydrogenase electron transfer subunit
MIRWFDRHTTVTVITTKSFQLSANSGYPEPIVLQTASGSLVNSVGLRNPGIDAAVKELKDLRTSSPPGALLNVSLSGKDAPEFTALAVRAAVVADILELNYSCPHASGGYGADIGRDEGAVTEITRAVVGAVPDLPVLVKLPPDVPDIASLAVAAVRAGAAGITAVNTAGPVIPRLPSLDGPVFCNPRNGQGGKSGSWIFETARDAIASIRGALGNGPILFGMGGVCTPEDAAVLRRAGADVVGAGSVLATLHQRDWGRLVTDLAAGDGTPGTRAGVTGDNGPSGPGKSAGIEDRSSPEDDFGYRSVGVHSLRELGDDLFELELRDERRRRPDVPQRMDKARPGRTVFLYIPGVGEKPFTTALTDPLTFLVRRRGPFTRALGGLKEGDPIYIRGPYGDPHYPAGRMRTLLLGGGSGVAALPLIAEGVIKTEGEVVTLAGFRRAVAAGAVEAALSQYGPCQSVPDSSDGGVLSRIPRTVSEYGPSVCYIVGPEKFMAAAASLIWRENPAIKIYFSLERSMRCGIGVCGECHHSGRLTCQYGTIVDAGEVLK